MITGITHVAYLISHCFRFQPIDPDTLVYSNEEDEVENVQNNSENSPKNLQLHGLSNECANLENRKTRNRRDERFSKKEFDVAPATKNRRDNDVFAGKDLDSISPLIKRLLIDTYKNHTKQEKSKRIRASRSRKITRVPYDSYQVDENTRKISVSNYNKWQSAICNEKENNITKRMKRSPHEDTDFIGKSSRSTDQNDKSLRRKLSEKSYLKKQVSPKHILQRLMHPRSQSLEHSPHSDLGKTRSIPVKRKVRYKIYICKLVSCNIISV